MASNRVPGGAISMNSTLRLLSATMCSGSPETNSSNVAGTLPSIEFSSGTMAASTVPFRTAVSAAVTVGNGMRSASIASGSVHSAASVNVPAGPRNAYLIVDSSAAAPVRGFGTESASRIVRISPISGGSSLRCRNSLRRRWPCRRRTARNVRTAEWRRARKRRSPGVCRRRRSGHRTR